MLELDELDHLHVVPDRTEQLGPGGIRHLRREPLTQRAVTEQRSEGTVLELGQELVLAARHGEDDRRPCPDRTIERIVGGRVAGMQADDEIDAPERLVTGDVADLEAEAGGAKRSRQRLTVTDDLGLEVQPDDLGLASVDDREQMMQRKREIGLARAEVDDPQRSGGERRKHVLDELEEAIHLPELVVATASHLPLGRHHPELDEERHRHALRQKAALDPVV